jgi:hypothetical protein
MPVLRASAALVLRRSNHTVMRAIHIAVTATTPQLTKDMELSMAVQLIVLLSLSLQVCC